jgi:hypothetical protein
VDSYYLFGNRFWRPRADRIEPNYIGVSDLALMRDLIVKAEERIKIRRTHLAVQLVPPMVRTRAPQDLTQHGLP